MLPQYHILFALIASLILYLFNLPMSFIILFFLAAVLMDIDHYFYYVAKKKNLDLFQAYKYHKYELIKELQKTKQKYVLIILHTLEFFILLFILSLIFSTIWPVFLGCLFHELTDLIYDSTRKEKKYKRAFSLIYYLTQ